MQKLKNLLKRRLPKLVQNARGIRLFFRKTNFEHVLSDNINLLKNATTFSYQDYAKNKFDKLLKIPSVFGFVEINNSCNINCVMCDTESSTRIKKLMPLDLVEKTLIAYKKEGIRAVGLHTIGDPLANKKLNEIFLLLRKYGFTTSLSTNGLMFRQHMNTLAEYTDVCSSLRFSIDGATKSTYEKIRVGGKYDDLLENLNLAKSFLPNIGYDLKISLTITKDNFNELGKFVNFCRPFVRNLSRDVSMSFMNSLAPKNDYFSIANVIPEKTYLNTHCHMVAAALPYTLVDGRISVCCRDYDGSLVVGDIANSSPISRIVEDSPYKNLLDFQEGKAKGVNNIFSYELCKTCYIVDDRIQTVWDQSISYILHKIPNANEFVLQNIFNQLLKCLKASDVAEYTNLMQSLK